VQHATIGAPRQVAMASLHFYKNTRAVMIFEATPHR